MKRALGFCDECPKCIIPDKGLYDGPNDPLIHFSVYTYQGRCAKHGIIPNGPTLCKLCEENDDKQKGLINRPTYGRMKHLTKMSFSIGEFHMVHYQPMLKKYAYHRMLLGLLCNNECKRLRREAFF